MAKTAPLLELDLELPGLSHPLAKLSRLMHALMQLALSYHTITSAQAAATSNKQNQEWPLTRVHKA